MLSKSVASRHAKFIERAGFQFALVTKTFTLRRRPRLVISETFVRVLQINVLSLAKYAASVRLKIFTLALLELLYQLSAPILTRV